MVIDALPKFVVRWAQGIAQLPKDKREEALLRAPPNLQSIIGRTAETVARASAQS